MIRRNAPHEFASPEGMPVSANDFKYLWRNYEDPDAMSEVAFYEALKKTLLLYYAQIRTLIKIKTDFLLELT